MKIEAVAAESSFSHYFRIFQRQFVYVGRRHAGQTDALFMNLLFNSQSDTKRRITKSVRHPWPTHECSKK